MSITYRPEVDGLRAVAVIPVILFHAGFLSFSGGYVGVDVFFVVSGYLITGIIYGEIRRGTFSIINFYERRARRILPVLFFITVACIPFAWLWLLPEDFKEFSQSVVAVNTFSSNIYFWQQLDYFDGPAELKPLLHTWSLAVEEQFYLFYPIFLMLFGWLKKQYLISAMLFVFAFSLALAEWGAENHPTANFYLLPTRAWELMAGSIIAVFLYDHGLSSKKLVNQAGSAAGLVLIIYSVVAFNDEIPFPSLWTLIPVLGASMVIMFAKGDTLVGRLLSWRPMVGVGLISYSVYLWHQPIFAFSRERSLNDLSGFDFAPFIALTFILSYFSWRFVEQPFRNKSFVSRSRIFSGAACGSILLISLGLYGSLSQGIPARMEPRVVELAAFKSDWDFVASDCQVYPGEKQVPENSCQFNEQYTDLVAIWGDSHATPLVGAMARQLEPFGYGVKQLVHTNCLPIVGYRRSDGKDGCTRYNEDVIDFLIAEEDIKIIMMVARYPLQFEGKRFDNEEGGVELGSDLYALPMDDFNNEEERVDKVGSSMRATVQTLLEHGKKVLLVYPIPEVGWDVPNHLAKEVLYGRERDQPLSTSYDVFLERVASTYGQFDRIEPNDNLLLIKPELIFCNTDLHGRCVAEMDGRPLYYDSNHLNNYGSYLMVDYALGMAVDAGWLNKKADRSLVEKK